MERGRNTQKLRNLAIPIIQMSLFRHREWFLAQFHVTNRSHKQRQSNHLFEPDGQIWHSFAESSIKGELEGRRQIDCHEDVSESE